MSISVARQENIIILQVTDEDAEQAYLGTYINLLWQQWAHMNAVHPDLAALYVKRECIKLLQPSVRRKVDLAEQQGTSLKLQQQYANLRDMLSETQTEIERIEKKARGTRPGASGQLKTTTGSIPPGSPNFTPPPPYVDANAQLYRGDAYIQSADDPTRGARTP